MRAIGMGLAALVTFAAASEALPADTALWRRIPSNYGLPVWMDARDLAKAQASKRAKKTVRFVVPGPFTENGWNPTADYSVITATYFCREAGIKQERAYFNTDGSLVRKDVDREKGYFIPGTVDVTIFGVVCQQDKVGGDVVELATIAEVLAYPKPKRPAPHP